MKVDCFKINGLYGSIVASGLPFVEEYNDALFDKNTCDVRGYSKKSRYLLPESNENAKHHIERCIKLCALGAPHCNFLTGINVSFNVTATQAFFLQAHRYHWWQVVSSMSKMHCLKKMFKKGKCSLHKKAKIVGKPIDLEDIEELVYSCPMGLKTTERVNTNYMQLRTIYAQRKDHRLTEWKQFCKWIERLPYAKEFICIEKDSVNSGIVQDGCIPPKITDRS